MSKKYCINCGTLIPESARFCPSCGAPQQGEEAKQLRANAPAVAFTAAAVAIEEASQSREEPGVDNSAKSKKTPASNEPAKETLEFIERRHLCKTAVFSFFLSYVTKTAILLLLFSIGIAFEPLLFSAAIAIYIVILYLAALVVFNNFYYAIDEVGFKKWYGLIHTQQVTIPYQQIQNVNINRSLSDRIFGLSRIIIETAGNASGTKSNVSGGTATTSEGYLPGVSHEQAKYIHDVLLVRAQEVS